MDILLKYDLRARSSYVQGTPILIGFSLENLSLSDLWILKWYTPMEGIKGKIFEVKCDGLDIPYEGRLVKRGNPGLDDYVHIHPAAAAHVEFDLSSAYSLPTCQECQLKFKGRIHDVLFDPQQVPRATGEHLAMEVPGNAASFSITQK